MNFLLFTPGEWRRILHDPEFLRDFDNSYRVPRRFMGLPVRIIPDHRFAVDNHGLLNSLPGPPNVH
jgi:hypothetical protein